ncbi:MAG TPA: ABC transporter permease, partial [bacterium]
MFKNYFKIAIRNLLKHRGYSMINVTGLAVGIACCWLILLFVHDELRYDRFHENADNICRVTIHGRMAGNDVTAATSPVPMAAALVAEYPEVMTATRIKQPNNTVLVGYGLNRFNEQRVYFADSTFFDVFTFPLKSGDAKTALREPFSVVITEEMAHKYFGAADPMGKILLFNNEENYRV